MTYIVDSGLLTVGFMLLIEFLNELFSDTPTVEKALRHAYRKISEYIIILYLFTKLITLKY